MTATETPTVDPAVAARVLSTNLGDQRQKDKELEATAGQRIEALRQKAAKPSRKSKWQPKQGQPLLYRRCLSPTEDPYEGIHFTERHIKLEKVKTGEVTMDRWVSCPEDWSDTAINTFTQHYFKTPRTGEEPEHDVRQSIDRIIDTPADWAMRGRKMPDGTVRFLGMLFADEQSAGDYAIDLKYAVVRQLASFNSPVWYNIGVELEGVRQQPSACFILNAEDKLEGSEGIFEWYTTEGKIFKGGSGSGLSLHKIRSSYEGVRGGGKASGPCRYMMTADSGAGTMSSGGRTRRAAKMVILPADHPDLLVQANGMPGFIFLKTWAEKALRAMAAAGMDMSVDSGLDAALVNFQNANNSVRYNGEFMGLWLKDKNAEWGFRYRVPELVWKEVKPTTVGEIWQAHAQASWECGDPGVQFDDTIQHWHTVPTSPNTGTNPCSEYIHMDNSPCNLAHGNLIKYFERDEAGRLGFDFDTYSKVSRLLAIHQTIMACYGDYPTDKIRDVAWGFRQIGQGYTNLGGLLMLLGQPYDSDEGRAWASVITSAMQATVGTVSAEIAGVPGWGPYPGDESLGLPGFSHPDNRRQHLRVAQMHYDYHLAIAEEAPGSAKARSLHYGDEVAIDNFHREVVGSGGPIASNPRLHAVWAAVRSQWAKCLKLGKQFGYANAHWSCIAPMGTNGMTLDQATSGVEPFFNHFVKKEKVAGDHVTLSNPLLETALADLGYSESEAADITAYVADYNSVVNAPHLSPEHYAVFDTANAEPVAGRFLSVKSHIKMVAAVQPFLSGGISKTINLPGFATVDDHAEAHYQAWRLGVKATALYRDGSKAAQPLHGAGIDGPPETERWQPRDSDNTIRIKLKVGGLTVFMHVGLAPNGRPDEIFFSSMAKGETMGQLRDNAAIASHALQYGTPIEAIIDVWRRSWFEPNGLLPKDSPFAGCNSIIHLAAMHLALRFISPEKRRTMGILTRAERVEQLEGEQKSALAIASPVPAIAAPAQVKTLTPAKAAAVAQPNGAPSGVSLLDMTEAVGAAPFAEKKFCYDESHAGEPVEMKRTGTCFACPRCGNSSGCS